SCAGARARDRVSLQARDVLPAHGRHAPGKILARMGVQRGRLRHDGAMTLTWPIALAVLFGALLHAGWNALVKSGQDQGLDAALLNLIAGVLALPMLAAAGRPLAAACALLGASALVHVASFR